MLTDAQWMRLEPLIEACRPQGKTPPQDLRRTLSAIVWRHQNGAKWRAIPAELGPWSRAAQTFLRWARLGVWERLLLLAQQRGVQLGMTFLDGTSIRAHQKAAGAARKGALRRSGIIVKPWVSSDTQISEIRRHRLLRGAPRQVGPCANRKSLCALGSTVRC